MPPIITLRFDSFSYSFLHNNLNTLHNVLDYYTAHHFTPPYITSALPQITKRDRTLPQPNNATRYTTIPLLYNMFLYCTEPLYFSVTIDNITVRYYSEHNLCYTYNKAHYTTNLCYTIRYHVLPLLHYTLPHHALPYHYFTSCYTVLCFTARHPTLPYHCLTAPQLALRYLC